MGFHLKIDDQYYISDINESDKDAFVEHLSNKDVSEYTKRIPWPYTAADADWWIKNVADITEKYGRSLNWAIRDQKGYLIGSVAFLDLEGEKASIGYWLAKPYWRQGIMSKAVKVVTELGFREFGFKRIDGSVFVGNKGSAGVLTKCGFKSEGVYKQLPRNDGTMTDVLLFSKVNNK